MTYGTAIGSRALSERVWLSALVVFAIALIVRAFGMSGHYVYTDEYMHFLAGKSFSEDGSFRIFEGRYDRAWMYTALTGFFFDIFGRADLFVARMPAMLAGALTVPVLFVWMHRVAGGVAAWTAALLLAFSGYSVELSLFSRFYTLQALLVLVGVLAVASAITRPVSARGLVLLAVAAFLFLVALHVQVTTIFALAALGLWCGLDLHNHAWFRALWEKSGFRMAGYAIVALVAIAAVAVGVTQYSEFRHTAVWAQENRNNVIFYLREYQIYQPILFYMFPVFATVSAARWPRETALCVLMLVVPLLVHSFGGMKAIRFLFYTHVFVLAVWGMAATVLLPAMLDWAGRAVDAVGTWLGRRPSPGNRGRLAIGISLLAIFAIVIGNENYTAPTKALLKDMIRVAKAPSTFFAPPPDVPWSGSKEKILAAIGHPEVLVTADDARAIAHLEPPDFTISKTGVSELDPPTDFERNPRTGVANIGEAASIEKVISCSASGAIVVPEIRWRTFDFVTPETADRIEAMAKPVTPGVEGFRIFEWTHPQSGGSDCAMVRGLMVNRQP